MLAHLLSGLSYSFTVHGPEEFDKAEAISLTDKIRHASFVVAISSFGRSQLFRWCDHGDWHKIKEVHCGLDAEFLQAPAVAVPHNQRLVCVGRLCEQKGQLLLLEAIRVLVQEQRQVELVLAGDGPMRADIEKLVANYGLSAQVRITGWISGQQVLQEIVASRALVLPSFAEGLPVVLMEACALRRPVVTTYIAGIPELVLHGETGWLVPAGSITELVDALRELLDAETVKLDSMGARAYERVSAQHDIRTECAKLKQLFHSILQEAEMEFLLWILVVLLLIPAVVVTLECLVASLPWREVDARPDQRRPNLAVLMPAHNESDIIAETLASIMPQLLAGDRVLVVADNCSDDTASIAEACGAQVVQRFNEELRGKGYALGFGMEALREAPPEILVIIDADCHLQAGALDTLAKTASKLDAPVQALYLMLASKESGVRQKIAAFAWVVKNQVRALGQYRLGMPCPLMGTGMAFPWHIINCMNLATGDLVEDMLLGGELVAAGHAPVFCSAAYVTSDFPDSDQAARTQRQRWEHGHLSMILNYFPSLLKIVLKRGDLRGMFFVLDMMVPPLALQSMLMLLGLGITGIAAWFGHDLPLQVMLVGTGLFVLALLTAWYRYAREVIGLQQLVQIPLYLLSKISLYVAYLFSREKNWVKTKR